MNINNTVTASVIIPTYNRSTLLDYTLRSILKQDVKPYSLEVIVVDDGSSDETVAVVNRYRNVLDLKYFFQEDKGYRVASARNIGIRNAAGKVLILIDSGVILGSQCIKEHIKTHETVSAPCVVIGYVYGYDQYIEDLDGLKNIINVFDPDETIKYLRDKGAFLDMRHEYYNSCNHDLNQLPAPWAYFITCNISFTAEGLLLVGEFDENFDYNWGVEDLELGYRFHIKKVQFYVNTNAESIHYPHDHESKMMRKFSEETVNKEYFHKKYGTNETKLFLESTFFELNDKILNSVSVQRSQNPNEQ